MRRLLMGRRQFLPVALILFLSPSWEQMPTRRTALRDSS